MSDGLINLLVVDDHWLVRLGLINLFGSLRHFNVVADETAAAGGSLLDPAVSDTVMQWMRGAAASGGHNGDRLSEQERKILPLIAEGKTNRQIAGELYLSEHTVKTYVSSLLKKLQLARRAEAAAYIARQQQARAS